MNELHHSLESMGVLQYLFAVAFLICYALAIGDFLGPAARAGVALAGFASAVGFSVFTDPWVHGVLLTAFAVIGIGLFIGAAWLLKLVFASAVGEVSVEAAYDDALSAGAATAPPSETDPGGELTAHRPVAEPMADASFGRLLGDGPQLDRRVS